MILKPACLAHHKPSMAVMHFGFLLSTAQRCSFTTLTLTAQRRASAQRCSSPLSQLSTTLTASHRCAPLLPPITGRADQSAVRLAQELAIRCGTPRHCHFFNNLNLDRVLHRHSYVADCHHQFYKCMYLGTNRVLVADVCWLFNKLFRTTFAWANSNYDGINALWLKIHDYLNLSLCALMMRPVPLSK